MSDGDSVCAVCQKISCLKCGRCRIVAYCSKDHQKLDWKEHKKVCAAHDAECFDIVEDEIKGRCMVASRFILDGEIVLEEAPLVTGPMHETPPVCLGCFTLLNKINSKDCSKCGWPVCSTTCENSSLHKPECEITVKYKKEKVSITTFGINHPSYQCITILRCLYLKNHSPRKWERIMSLESHREDLKKSKKYENDMALIGQFIPRFLNCSEFTEDEITKAFGIILVNSHHIPFKEPGYIAIYDKGSIAEHSCRSNCSKTFSEDGKLIVRAEGNIKKGDHISICYSHPFWGVEARQEFLLTTKFFTCKCERCVDPTELGTHFNSYKCLRPECKGYFVIKKRAEVPDNLWLCTTCKKIYTDEDLKDLTAVIKGAIQRLDDSDPKSCKAFLSAYGKYFHKNHNLMVKVKLGLIRYSKENEYNGASDEDLQFIVKTIEDLNRLVSHLAPSEKRLRGFLYYQLHKALVEQINRELLRGEMGESEKRQKLLVIRNILQKVHSFLKFQPEALFEGQLGLKALEHIADIDKALLETQLLC